MTWLRVLALRFSGMFGKRQRDAQLEEELQSHLEMLVEQNLQRGMPAPEARRAAKLSLGGAEQIKEAVRDQRGLPLIESLIADIRFALRMLRKNPGFTAVAILTLALGIGASTVVFSVYYNFLFNAYAARDASRLAVPLIKDADAAGGSSTTIESLMQCSAPNFDAIREAFEDIVCYGRTNVLLSDGQETRQLVAGYVTANAFSFYGVPPLLGRGIVPEDAKPGATPIFVMSYSAWKGEFNADPLILGKSFTVNDEPRTLVGVMPPRFQGFGALVRVWMPVDIHDESSLQNNFAALTLGRLKPGVTLNEASANLDVIVKRLAKDRPNSFPKHFVVRVQSAADFLMGSYGIGNIYGSTFSVKHMIYSLLAGVLMLLLIACGNVANLLLARATVREKEISVRAALGATRGRIVRQLLTESSLLAAAACAVGCLFAYLGLRGATAIMPETSNGVVGGEVVLGLDVPVLFFALGITALTTLICGLIPALRVAGTHLQAQLAGSGKGIGGSFRHGTIRASLMVSQVAFSIVLLTGAGLIIRSFFLLVHVDLGFSPQHVFVATFGSPTNGRLPQDQVQTKLTLQNEKFAQLLRTVPGVEEVAIDDTLAGYGGGRGSHVTTPGSARSEEAGIEPCNETLPQTLGMRMVSGKWFSKADVDSSLYVAVVNQAMARKLWGDENRVGQLFEVKSFKPKGESPRDANFQVVGVVHDMKNLGPEQPARPEAFIPYTLEGSGVVLLSRTKADPDSMIRPIEEQIWAIDPDVTFGIAESLENFFDRLSYSAPKFGVMTIAPVAGIALLLVMSGIFSVMAYTVSLHTREIGIRMALGAQLGDISRMVLRKGLELVAAGVAIGSCASFALTRFLASQIWGVSPTDPWTFSAVIAVIVVVGLAACYIPAHRATRVDPMVALRYE
jgi:putative ABC transport system permease protein